MLCLSYSTYIYAASVVWLSYFILSSAHLASNFGTQEDTALIFQTIGDSLHSSTKHIIKPSFQTLKGPRNIEYGRLARPHRARSEPQENFLGQIPRYRQGFHDQVSKPRHNIEASVHVSAADPT